MQGVTYGRVWVFVIYSVASIGVTTGTVLQTVVYEVACLVMMVGSVTTEVDVFVLVTSIAVS